MNEKPALPITMVATTDFSGLINPAPGRRQPMKGFDPEFVDIADYIVRITSWIWDDKNVELCKRYYSDDGIIHTLAGEISGVDTVIANTWKTLEGWPDRTLNADNVIWSGNEDDGYYSSHLITSQMTNSGPSEFGPPTGKKARVRTVADCLCHENKIIEEWLMRDNLGLTSQMGLDGNAIALSQAKADFETNSNLQEMHKSLADQTMVSAIDSSEFPKIPEDNAELFAQAYVSRLWNKRQLESLPEFYDYRIGFEGPSGRNLYGTADIEHYFQSFLTMMPNLKVTVDHVADVPYLGGARDIAVRWSLTGIHSGGGIYGAPTDKPIYIMGSSHWRIINGRIRNEWTVFDELAILRQVHRNRLSG